MRSVHWSVYSLVASTIPLVVISITWLGYPEAIHPLLVAVLNIALGVLSSASLIILVIEVLRRRDAHHVTTTTAAKPLVFVSLIASILLVDGLVFYFLNLRSYLALLGLSLVTSVFWFLARRTMTERSRQD
jgi:hypothetical protein